MLSFCPFIKQIILIMYDVWNKTYFEKLQGYIWLHQMLSLVKIWNDDIKTTLWLIMLCARLWCEVLWTEIYTYRIFISQKFLGMFVHKEKGQSTGHAHTTNCPQGWEIVMPNQYIIYTLENDSFLYMESNAVLYTCTLLCQPIYNIHCIASFL